MPKPTAPIGVFDSGIGGLSVLRDLCAALPHEQFIYFADSAHAPYGEKGDAYVQQRSLAITDQLRTQHALKALVVACNTATAAAINSLRAQHPDLIIIGIEPALKPAAAASRSKHVTVFATRGTLASSKFAQLLAQQSDYAQFDCIACDGLAEAIETHSGDLRAEAIVRLVQRYVLESKVCAANNTTHSQASTVDTVVLGCTHYPLIKTVFQACLPPHVSIVDNGAAVAKRLSQQLAQLGLLSSEAKHQNSAVRFESSATLLPNWAGLLARSA